MSAGLPRTWKIKDLRPELLSIQGMDEEIKDRFAVKLAFGTAGLRGVLGSAAPTA